MSYELTVTMRLDSDHSEDRIAKMFESLFEFGTIKESIALALKLLDDPRLVTVAITRAPSDQPTQPDSSS